MAERDAAVVQTLQGPEGLLLVRLEFKTDSGCGRCNEPGGCGGISLAQPLCAKPRSIVVSDPIGLAVGDHVRVSIPDAALSQGVTRTYVIPLVLFFAGSLLGAAILPDVLPIRWQVSADVGAMVGAGLGLIAAWAQLRHAHRHIPMAMPRILERL
jgi:sigma-E factor negative regulatory protein RseC